MWYFKEVRSFLHLRYHHGDVVSACLLHYLYKNPSIVQFWFAATLLLASALLLYFAPDAYLRQLWCVLRSEGCGGA
jgi:hypothetical protein